MISPSKKALLEKIIFFSIKKILCLFPIFLLYLFKRIIELSIFFIAFSHTFSSISFIILSILVLFLILKYFFVCFGPLFFVNNYWYNFFSYLFSKKNIQIYLLFFFFKLSYGEKNPWISLYESFTKFKVEKYHRIINYNEYFDEFYYSIDLFVIGFLLSKYVVDLCAQRVIENTRYIFANYPAFKVFFIVFKYILCSHI